MKMKDHVHCFRWCAASQQPPANGLESLRDMAEGLRLSLHFASGEKILPGFQVGMASFVGRFRLDQLRCYNSCWFNRS